MMNQTTVSSTCTCAMCSCTNNLDDVVMNILEDVITSYD